MASDQTAPLLLYVEDEILIQTVVDTALREAGFDVLIACDGDEALDLLRSRIGTLNGLITDIMLGDGPNGWEIARTARELSSGLPVLYVSGTSEHQWTSDGVPGSLIISKPFAPTQIVVAISSLLVTNESQL